MRQNKHLFFFVVTYLMLSCNHSNTSTANNKELASKYINEVINNRKLELIESIFSHDYVSHRTDGKEAKIIKDGSLRMFLTLYQKAFPDLHYTIDNIVSEGDMVAINMTATGTQKDAFFGYPASQKLVRYKEMFFFRVADKKLVEGWGLADIKGILEQISKL